MKIPHLALFGFLLGASTITQGATIMISQPTFTRLEDYQPTGFGQSFTANGTYPVGAINLYISSSFGGSDITLRLLEFNSLASTLGSSVLASGALKESALSPTGGWKTVSLETPYKVSSGASYAFTIIAKDPGGSATGWNNYGVSDADVYSGGNQLSIGSGNPVTKQTADLSFQIVLVPEPSTSLLFAAAAMVLSGHRTRHSIERAERRV